MGESAREGSLPAGSQKQQFLPSPPSPNPTHPDTAPQATADKERYRGKRDMMAARNADLQQVLLDWSTGAVEDRAALDRLQAICEGA